MRTGQYKRLVNAWHRAGYFRDNDLVLKATPGCGGAAATPSPGGIDEESQVRGCYEMRPEGPISPGGRVQIWKPDLLVLVSMFGESCAVCFCEISGVI